MVRSGDRGAHRWREAAYACRPPVDDLSALAIDGSGGRAIGRSGLPLLLDTVCRQLAGGIAVGCLRIVTSSATAARSRGTAWTPTGAHPAVAAILIAVALIPPIVVGTYLYWAAGRRTEAA